MRRRRFDAASLAAGLLVAGLGVLLLLEARGEIDLTGGLVTASLALTAGVALLVGGLVDRRRRGP